MDKKDNSNAPKPTGAKPKTKKYIPPKAAKSTEAKTKKSSLQKVPKSKEPKKEIASSSTEVHMEKKPVEISKSRNKTTLQAYMDNMTVGVSEFSNKLGGVIKVQFTERTHVQESDIRAWERENECIIPPDLKKFYLASDGIRMRWIFKKKGAEITQPVGCVEIVKLADLKCILPRRGVLPVVVDIESDSEEIIEGHRKPKFKDGRKVFVLDFLLGAGRVCLVYPKKKASSDEHAAASSVSSGQAPSVWFLDRALDFHYLCKDFESYYRLAMAHLGIPQWPILFTPYDLPTRTRLLLNMFVPERLVLKPDYNSVTSDQEIDSSHGMNINSGRTSISSASSSETSSSSTIEVPMGEHMGDESEPSHETNISHRGCSPGPLCDPIIKVSIDVHTDDASQTKNIDSHRDSSSGLSYDAIRGMPMSKHMVSSKDRRFPNWAAIKMCLSLIAKLQESPGIIRVRSLPDLSSKSTIPGSRDDET